MSSQLTLNGATIVDTRDGTLTRDVAIVMDAGKIAKIAPAASEGGTGEVVDARGKFVVPGYLDCHAHPLNAADPEGSLTLMLANGITGFRQMSGTPDTLAARRAGKLMPSFPAPELLEMPGTILTKANAATPAAAVAEIRKQHEAGADFLKVIDVDPETFHAIAAEAKRLGLRFLGHLNPDVSPLDAARAGMRSIEHLGPRDSLLLSCSTEETELRKLVTQAPSRPPISGPIPEGVILRAIANPVLFTAPAETERYARVIDTYSEAKLRELAATLAAEGMWQAPTLIRIRTQMHGDEHGYRNDPNLRYVPLVMRQIWEELAQQFPARLSATARETLDRLFELLLKVVKPMKESGVQMLAGSDSGGSAGWAIPGFSLHQEFDLLERAGLAPLEILQMTTCNGAKFLGRESTMGSVAEGKHANLVLLDADPTANAQNLHGINAVVRDGTYLSRDALSAMKQRTEERVATLPPPTTPPPASCC